MVNANARNKFQTMEERKNWSSTGWTRMERFFGILLGAFGLVSWISLETSMEQFMVGYVVRLQCYTLDIAQHDGNNLYMDSCLVVSLYLFFSLVLVSILDPVISPHQVYILYPFIGFNFYAGRSCVTVVLAAKMFAH